MNYTKKDLIKLREELTNEHLEFIKDRPSLLDTFYECTPQDILDNFEPLNDDEYTAYEQGMRDMLTVLIDQK